MIRVKIMLMNDSNARVLGDLLYPLREIGINIIKVAEGSADLMICHQSKIKEAIATGLPIIVVERIAGGRMSQEVKENIENPLVKKVLRSAYQIDRNSYLIKCPQKISLGWSLACHRQMKRFLVSEDRALSSARPIDASFVGVTEYCQSPRSATEHRKGCVRAMREQLAGLNIVVVEGDRVHPAEYRKIMLSSKIVISPWGWGETCYRDYEAVLLGCEVVKPDTSHLEDASGLFPSAGLWRWCKQDFSDLGNVVKKTLDNMLTPEAKIGRRRLIAQERGNLAARLKKEITSALE